MARLRSGVEARIAASMERRPTFRRTGWALALHTPWVGMATGGGFAIMAGMFHWRYVRIGSRNGQRADTSAAGAKSMSGPIDVATMINTGRDVPRWRRIALPASILLNLFLVAVIGGHMWRVRAHEAAFVTPMARVLARAEANLPAQDAAAFGAVIRRDAPRYADAQKRLLDASRRWSSDHGGPVQSGGRAAGIGHMAGGVERVLR